jgi:hypothetical protein
MITGVVSAGDEEIRCNEKQESLRAQIANVRDAVFDLMATYAERYAKGAQFLSDLERIEKEIAASPTEHLEQLEMKFSRLRREALLANPLVREQPILFVVRPQYLPDHHSTATMFQTGEINTNSFRGGGALKTIHFGNGGVVQTLLEAPEGIVRDPEIDFDGMKILFSLRHRINDDYHIHELDLCGTGVRQLTFGSGLTDIDPMYLPDGQIVFVSTREPKYCQCNRHIMGNLFKMDANGANIRQIGRNTLFEGHPSLLPDGRILYARWEYVDKHFGPAFGLWTVNPDGTNHAVYYGNNAWSPGAILDARAIAGTQQVVATFGSCHDRPWGAIAIVDRRYGLDGTYPVIRSWPADIDHYLTNRQDYGDGKSRHHPAGGQIDNFTGLPIKYEDPFPLSEKYFLCSRTIEGERMGIFLLDTFGNEILLHSEGPGCYDPMPLRPRARPPVITNRTDYAKQDGYFYVADVYKGDGMENVARGAAKTLRIVEAPVKLFWTQTNWNLDATQAPAMNFNCTNNKRILGDAPVEADGSAYFAVPADTFVFFQLLDENGMMIHSMRSGTMVQPGETIGCVGCHENRLTTIENRKFPLAMMRAPSEIKPWYGPPRDFNYLTEVQPVFDRYCVRCHDYGKEAGETLNLSGDLGLVFNTSYLELRTKSALRWFPDAPGGHKLLVKAVDDGPAEVLPPYSWGSHRSRLAEVIRGKHHGITVDQESRDRVITWIDMNAPYYGSYASVYPDNVFGRSPLNDQEIEALRRLTGVQVGDISTELLGSQVNFTRPEFSPCLAAVKANDPDSYQTALQIIGKGKERLEQKPRMDMPGARLSDADLKVLKKYNEQGETEKEIRRLISQKSKPNQIISTEY